MTDAVHDSVASDTPAIDAGRIGLGEVLRLVTGAGAAHAIVAVATPILTRLYSPADFGQFQIYTTVFSFFFVVAAWRYEVAVLLPKREEDSVTVMVLALAVVLLNAGLCGLALALLGWLGLLGGRLDVLHRFGWLMPFAVIGGGASTVLTQWALRQGDYTGVSVARVAQSLTLVGTQVGSGLSGVIGLGGLMIGDAVGRLAGSAGLGRSAWRSRRALIVRTRIPDVWAMAIRYWRFPLISSGSALINTGGIVLPTFFLSGFGVAPLGWFALVDRVIGSPSSLVGLSVSQVYSAKAAKLAHDDPAALRTLFRELLIRLAWTGAVPFTLMALAGPWLFAFVFGESWRSAGEYARILAVMQYVGFVTWPLLPTLNLLEHQDWQLAWDVGRLILCGGVMGVAWKYGGTALWVVTAYSGSMLVAYCVHTALSYAAIKRRLPAAARGR